MLTLKGKRHILNEDRFEQIKDILVTRGLINFSYNYNVIVVQQDYIPAIDISDSRLSIFCNWKNRNDMVTCWNPLKKESVVDPTAYFHWIGGHSRKVVNPKNALNMLELHFFDEFSHEDQFVLCDFFILICSDYCTNKWVDRFLETDNKKQVLANYTQASLLISMFNDLGMSYELQSTPNFQSKDLVIQIQNDRLKVETNKGQVILFSMLLNKDYHDDFLMKICSCAFIIIDYAAKKLKLHNKIMIYVKE
ncbi:MAG: hypothetical protein KC646_01075 [Candidatus Cloacimonetes bacterium]|nr:hypothetical protein [Candidatus Cloacimonadota bacterium]